MKLIFTILIAVFVSNFTYSQNQVSVTKSLMKNFDEAWNNKNVNALDSLLQPDAFFESPYQIRDGREAIDTTIFRFNIHIFRNGKSTENYSHIDNNIAWSVGNVTADYLNKKNEIVPWNARYTFIFSKGNDNSWKIQMMIYHEK